MPKHTPKRYTLTQMEQSKDGPNCVYRGPEGLKCAAGCLIGDDEYDPEMEHQYWIDLISRLNITNNHMDLIMELQRIHDCSFPYEWKGKLEELSKQFNLEWKFE